MFKKIIVLAMILWVVVVLSSVTFGQGTTVPIWLLGNWSDTEQTMFLTVDDQQIAYNQIDLSKSLISKMVGKYYIIVTQDVWYTFTKLDNNTIKIELLFDNCMITKTLVKRN